MNLVLSCVVCRNPKKRFFHSTSHTPFFVISIHGHCSHICLTLDTRYIRLFPSFTMWCLLISHCPQCQTICHQSLTAQARSSATPMHFSRPGRRKKLIAFYLLAILCLITPTIAIWPFPPKRFRGNSLIDAGAMGLSGDGRVVAFGDFNGDQL